MSKRRKKKVVRCQFCGLYSNPKKWLDNECPFCDQKYDPNLAQEMDEC